MTERLENMEAKLATLPEQECSWCNLAKLLAVGVTLAGAGAGVGMALGKGAKKSQEVQQQPPAAVTL